MVQFLIIISTKVSLMTTISINCGDYQRPLMQRHLDYLGVLIIIALP